MSNNIAIQLRNIQDSSENIDVLNLCTEAVNEIERLQADRDHWYNSFFDIHKELTLSLISHDWQLVRKTQMKMWKIRKDFEMYK